jgi:protein Mpv17
MRRQDATVVALAGLALFCLGAVQAFVTPCLPPQQQRQTLGRGTGSSTSFSSRRPSPAFLQPPRSARTSRLWIKTPSMADDKSVVDKKLETPSFAPITSLETTLTTADDPTASPQDRARSLAAANGIDSRQFDFLVNVGLISLVAAVVLAKVVTVDLDSWRGWTPAEIFTRIPLDNWDGYMNVLTLHPILVKAITSGSVYTLGDTVAQLYEGKTLGEIDRGRVGRSAAAGFIGHGPLSHLWYGVSAGFFDWLGWEGWWTTFPKITVDQLVWSPIWNGCYIFLLGAMKREALGEIIGTVKSTSFNLITSGLKLWPLAHVVTYGFIPVENRLLWVDLVEILWVTILSREAANADAEKAEAAETAAEAAAGIALDGEGGYAPGVLLSKDEPMLMEEKAGPVQLSMSVSMPVVANFSEAMAAAAAKQAQCQNMVAVPVHVEDDLTS